MKTDTLHRLQSLRMENDAAKFAQEEMRPRFDALATRHENGTAPRAITVYQLFQTPADLAGRMVASLGDIEGKRCLEPSAGLGRLLDPLQAGNPAEIVAVETSPNCAGELFRQNREGVKLLQRDFLTVTPEEVGLFDAVAMNPPFHMRSDIRHILHALRFVRPGGILSALCMDTHHRETILRPLSSSWEKIEAGTFREAGTGIACILLTIKKI